MIREVGDNAHEPTVWRRSPQALVKEPGREINAHTVITVARANGILSLPNVVCSPRQELVFARLLCQQDGFRLEPKLRKCQGGGKC